MIASLLVANRGEIAVRIFRTARAMGVKCIAVYSDADAKAKHVRDADVALRIGPPPAKESYLNSDAILRAAKESGAEAIHPGYGFLSENPDFAQAVIDAGLIWVGPSPAAIRAMGLKDEAKRIAEEAGVPVLPGYRGADQSEKVLREAAKEIGFPVLIKAVAGGGGRGIREVNSAGEFSAALASARRESAAAFGDDRVLIEKFIARARHIEVQVFGDSQGNLVHLFERDCSLQRRRQKVIEEAPAPGMTEEVRAAMTEAALKLARAVNYENAGTVEFIVDATGPLRPDGFWFMEMNTRLQVEHPVTEFAVCVNTSRWPQGNVLLSSPMRLPSDWRESARARENLGSSPDLHLDLVEWQLRAAAGEVLPVKQEEIVLHMFAIEARICAEAPDEDFRPKVGKIRDMFSQAPHRAGAGRADWGYGPGDEVSSVYDNLVAKIIVSSHEREDAISNLSHCLSRTIIDGLTTNVGFLVRCLEDADFMAGRVHTGLITEHSRHLVDRRTVMQDAAAAFSLRLLAGGADKQLWSAVDGWRLNAPASKRVVLYDGYEAVAVDLSEISQEPDGFLSLPHAWTGRIDGRSLRAEFREFNGQTYTTVRGETFRFRLDVKRDAAEAEMGDAIVSPLPGKVVSLNTKPGAAVKRGDPLVVVEAMKMEHALKAPRDGVVAEIGAREGEQVKQAQMLVKLAAREEKA